MLSPASWKGVHEQKEFVISFHSRECAVPVPNQHACTAGSFSAEEASYWKLWKSIHFFLVNICMQNQIFP